VLIGVEMGIDFTLPDTSFVFRSIIDRALKISEGVLEIADYKTGGGNLPAADDPSFRTQMGLYQLAVQARYPQFREIELAQYWLKHDEEVRTRLRPEELDELTLQLKDEVVATRMAEQMNDWPTKESNL
jgi:RecB family exonuclease